MIRDAQSKAVPQVSLHSGSSISAAWQNVILPWFKMVSGIAWQSEEATAVVVPYRSHAHFLKTLLLKNEVPLLGVHFFTPASLRESLQRGTATKIPLREHLRLLLGLSAEQELPTPSVSTEQDEMYLAAARSVSRAPDHLLRAIDQLSPCGWSFTEVGPPSLRKITQRFRTLVERCDFQLIHDADRATLDRAAEAAPFFSNVLIAGFNGAHWPLWLLLRAAVNASARATVVLDDPRDEARDLDESWVGTWEEIFGAATPIESSARHSDTLFPELFELERFTRNARTANLPAQIHFIVGRSTTEQAEAVVALIRHFLASESTERIGVLFPSAGALARIVASLLTDAEIPHNDGIAHIAPGPLEDDAWRAWLELQENPRLRIFLGFLRALPDIAHLFGGLRVDQIEKILRNAYCDLLIDDLDLLREYCARRSELGDADKIVAGLTAVRFLPKRATFREYLADTREIFLHFSWIERWASVEEASAAWSDRVPGEFSRAIYLRWLSEISTSLLSTRDAVGDHPYSRVQLLLYPHAEGQQWTHLIFTGLNEGSWPPGADESGFLSDDEIDALNTQIRKLNRRVLSRGSQGEGHSVVAKGKTFCLGARERRQLAERQFRNLLESATAAVGLAANLVDESAPERLANPSEFYTQVYFEARGEALSQAIMSTLQRETRAWVEKQSSQKKPTQSTDVRQTIIAYETRRDADKQFSEYEFSLPESPNWEVQLSATAWGQAIKTPALVWMEKFLDVAATEDEFVNWSLVTGQWVHRWLRQIAHQDAEGRFIPLLQPQAMRERVRRAAMRFRDEVAALLASRDRQLPDWWLSGWKHAVYVADCLTAIVAMTEGWSHFATEWTLPEHSIQLGNNEHLSIKGRIDLLLARGERPNERLPFSDLWVVDYKTGGRKSLAPSRNKESSPTEQFNVRLRKGEGLQLALYALALSELGAADVAVSLLTRDLELDRPQVGINEIAAQQEFWRELARMAASGVFGMRGAIRSEFSFQNNYPLATLSIDPDLLEEKWARTHPALARPEADE
jgi:hypothetical protein